MFVREKTARGHRYLYLVESVRDGGRVRQQIVRALGRKDVLLASGELDRLVASLARHSERAMILSEMETGRLSCTRIGRPAPVRPAVGAPRDRRRSRRPPARPRLRLRG